MPKREATRQSLNLRNNIQAVRDLSELSGDTLELAGGKTTTRQREVNDIEQAITQVVNKDVNHLKRGRENETNTFLSRISADKDIVRDKEGDVVQVDEMEMRRIFEEQAENLYAFFNKEHQAKNAKFDEIDSVTKRLNDLEEAVFAFRDSILTSDNLTASISRTLEFINKKVDDEYGEGVTALEQMERDYKLTKRIRDHIVPKTLQYGCYYAYTVPYSEIIKRHMYLKGIDGNRVMESSTSTCTLNEEDMSAIFESVALEHNISEKYTEKELQNVTETANKIIDNISVVSEEDHIILEMADMSGISELAAFKKNQNAKKTKEKTSSESVKEFDEVDGISECYIKLIDPRKIIPIRIMEETIGYYYIDDSVGKGGGLSTSMICSEMDALKRANGGGTGDDIEGSFITRIVDNIVRKFNRPFLEENMEFKHLIVDALLYNDTYRKNVQFQFIPVEYITEFKINEDENGNGVSILEPSLFYANLYLSLLMFHMITIVGYSADQRVYYIKKSGVDADVTNQVQRIAREIRQNQLNFNDLLTQSQMVSKAGRGKALFIPVGESDQRSLEFDTMAGQDIQVQNELMEEMKKAALNTTGVPSVLSNYINDAEYAKTLVMANAKMLARTVMFQQDFNESITEFYKKLAKFGAVLEDDMIDAFRYSLALPSSLNTMNYTDLINNVDQLIAFFVKVLTGEQGEQTELDNITKDEFYRRVSKDYLRMFDWNRLEDMLADSQLEAVRTSEQKKAQSTEMQ